MLGIKILSKKKYLALLEKIERQERWEETRKQQVTSIVRDNRELRGSLSEYARKYNELWEEVVDLRKGRTALNKVKKLIEK